MANSDYIIRNARGPLCPSAILASNLGRLDAVVTISGYSALSTDPIRLGSAAMIGSEIVAITARQGNTLTLARGCVDTIPSLHAAGERIWFFDDFVASDRFEYGAYETISVKPLPRTPTNKVVTVAQSPPTTISFNARFARPYPPANVLVGSQPWFAGFRLSNMAPTLNLSWNHRDRVVQQDVLLAHGASDVGPESGTTYEVGIFDESGAELASFTGITGKTFSYAYTDAVTDFGAATATKNGSLRLRSRRGGLASWQEYVIPLIVNANNQSLGTPPTRDLDLAWTVAQQPPTAVFRSLPLNWQVLNAPPQNAVLFSETGIFIRDPARFEFRYDIRVAGTVTALMAVTMFINIDGFLVTLNFVEGIHVYREGNSIFMTAQGEALLNQDLSDVIPTPAVFDFYYIPA